MQVVKDETMPSDKWAFDGEVTTVFDDMLARSIPQYDVMRQACFDLACKYRKPDTWIVDLGCSRGEAIAQLVDKYGVNNRFLGVEVSEPMLLAARSRFKELIDCGIVEIQRIDLREVYPPVAASITLCILTLQFTPIEYRLRIMQDIYDSLLPNGALILVEKVIGASAALDKNMVDIYYKLKADNGYSQEQIERKRLSLEGVLVPVTAHWNEEMLRIVGFRQVDCFWRWMNFAGWIALKEGA
jgi:tRNA (cmo5U34)-methyltransferase